MLIFADYIKSCASLEVCRQVIVAFDSSGLGRITFSNFKDLMCSLKLWHGVFKNNAKEKSGILIADRLRDALSEVGFQLNSAILSVLMMRYIRKDGTLRFGDFVAIILNLSIAFGKKILQLVQFCPYCLILSILPNIFQFFIFVHSVQFCPIFNFCPMNFQFCMGFFS